MKKTIISTVSLMSLACFAQAQTVANGSFEDISGLLFQTNPLGDFYQGTPNGWTGPSAQIHTAAYGISSGQGVTGVDGDFYFDQSSAGTFTQDISGFMIGETYRLDYKHGNHSNLGSLSNLSVTMGGVTNTHAIAGPAGLFDASLTFVAGGPTETLSFTTAAGPSLGELDAFTITAIPEPTSTALLGLGGLALLLRRKK